ncbi:MAG: right-handed parallel beta-helix repeat-containing protein, partial [Pikeienuella sp.]
MGVWRPYNARGPAPAPTFLRCRFAGAEIGINVSDGATATLEACELLDNEVGLCVLDGAQVRVLRCRFSGNRRYVIGIYDAESGGEFIGND